MIKTIFFLKKKTNNIFNFFLIINFTTDTFQQLYEWAIYLIKNDKAYVCHQKVEEVCLFCLLNVCVCVCMYEMCNKTLCCNLFFLFSLIKLLFLNPDSRLRHQGEPVAQPPD